MRELETDYLVVGAGASAMAFVDALLDLTDDVDVVMVDRRFRPAGHWNDAYPFVRLHQPSANYGVHTRQLGHDRVDETGPNAGFYERATAAEIVDYFGRVMDETFLPSGRVRFLAKHDYRGEDAAGHRVVSLFSGEETIVRVRKKVVDATVVESSIPSRHTPSFSVDDDVRFVTPNTLVDIDEPMAGFTVLGAGKTAMDTCLWLLEAGVAADRIQWVRPEEPWMINRACLQPLDQVGSIMQFQAAWLESMAKAGDSREWFHLLEDAGVMHRFDRTSEPTAYRAALLSEREAKELRTIDNVVRGARVQRLSATAMQTRDGDVAVPRGQVFVDCTAAGIASYEVGPIYEPGKITLMYIVPGTVTWGAAMIGALEAMRDDDAEKNALLPAIPPPKRVEGVMDLAATHVQGMLARMGDAEFNAWHEASRVNLSRGAMDRMDDPRVSDGFMRMMSAVGDALANVERLRAAHA